MAPMVAHKPKTDPSEIRQVLLQADSSGRPRDGLLAVGDSGGNLTVESVQRTNSFPVDDEATGSPFDVNAGTLSAFLSANAVRRSCPFLFQASGSIDL